MLQASRVLETAQALVAADSGRAAALPVSPQEAMWEGFRTRNTALDSFFYDVGSIDPEEARRLGAVGIREGSFLLVPPSGAGPITACATLDDFVLAGGGGATSLCIAGVGSSALGSAAFARNVADATGEPAAAVVSGYGVSDLVSEALGGWFWFGTVNSLRHRFEPFERAGLPDPTPAAAGVSAAAITSASALSHDTRAAFALLCDSRLNFRVLTGHSKGNLVLSEALYAYVAWCKDQPRVPDPDWLIVTFSAAIAMPRDFAAIVDVMGLADPLGRLNSRPDIGIERRVPWAGHHTNSAYPGHLPVTRELRDILAARASAA